MGMGGMFFDSALAEVSDCGICVEDRIMPAQFRDLLHHSSEVSGEHRLMAALLEDALLCWLNAANPRIYLTLKREKEHREADAWIFGGYQAPLSFEQVCGWLDLDPDYIRRELRGLNAAGFQPEPGSVARPQAGTRTKATLIRKRHARICPSPAHLCPSPATTAGEVR